VYRESRAALHKKCTPITGLQRFPRDIPEAAQAKYAWQE
jgi:hypothetical protein